MKLSDEAIHELLEEQAIDELSTIAMIQSYLLKGSTLSITGIVVSQPHLDFYGKAEGFDVNIRANLAPRGDGPCSAAIVSAEGCVYIDKKTKEVASLTLRQVQVKE